MSNPNNQNNPSNYSKNRGKLQEQLYKIEHENWLLGKVTFHATAKTKKELLQYLQKHDILPLTISQVKE